jgi:hypothetical protein
MCVGASDGVIVSAHAEVASSAKQTAGTNILILQTQKMTNSFDPKWAAPMREPISAAHLSIVHLPTMFSWKPPQLNFSSYFGLFATVTPRH